MNFLRTIFREHGIKTDQAGKYPVLSWHFVLHYSIGAKSELVQRRRCSYGSAVTKSFLTHWTLKHFCFQESASRNSLTPTLTSLPMSKGVVSTVGLSSAGSDKQEGKAGESKQHHEGETHSYQDPTSGMLKNQGNLNCERKKQKQQKTAVIGGVSKEADTFC